MDTERQKGSTVRHGLHDMYKYLLRINDMRKMCEQL